MRGCGGADCRPCRPAADVSSVIVCAAWEYAGRVPISPAFPTFLETMAALWRDDRSTGRLIKAFAITLEPLVVGLAASVIAGVGLGVLMGLNRFAEWLGAPLFIIAQAAPLAALIPILTFAYGIGLTAKVLTVCIMAMPVIVLNSLNAVRHTPTSLIEMGRSFSGLASQPDHQDHPAGGEPDDLRRPPARLRPPASSASSSPNS